MNTSAPTPSVPTSADVAKIRQDLEAMLKKNLKPQQPQAPQQPKPPAAG